MMSHVFLLLTKRMGSHGVVGVYLKSVGLFSWRSDIAAFASLG